MESASGTDEHYNSEESAHQGKRTTQSRTQQLCTIKLNSLSIQCVPSMYRGRVFISDCSPTTLRYYTVMPANNYIPGIFQGLNRIFTSFSRSHSGPYCPLGPDTRHHSVNLAFAVSGALAPRRLSSQLLAWLRRRLLLNLLAIFDFAVGALVFASLR